MAQRSLTRLLQLSGERLFERVSTHAKEGVSGCEYLAELAGGVLSLLVVLVSRQGRTVSEACPELLPHPMTTLLRALTKMLRSEIEEHCGNARLESAPPLLTSPC